MDCTSRRCCNLVDRSTDTSNESLVDVEFRLVCVNWVCCVRVGLQLPMQIWISSASSTTTSYPLDCIRNDGSSCFLYPSVCLFLSLSIFVCVCLCVSVCSFEREWTRETVRRRDESESLRLEKRMRKRQRTVATRFLGLHRWILLFHPRLYRPNTSPASLCYKLDTHITFSKPLFAWIADRRTNRPTDQLTDGQRHANFVKAANASRIKKKNRKEKMKMQVKAMWM